MAFRHNRHWLMLALTLRWKGKKNRLTTDFFKTDSKYSPLGVEQHSKGDKVLFGEARVVHEQAGPEGSCTQGDLKTLSWGYKFYLSDNRHMNYMSALHLFKTGLVWKCYYHSDVVPVWAAARRRPLWRVAAWRRWRREETVRRCSWRGEWSSSPAGAASAAPPQSPAVWGSEWGEGISVLNLVWVSECAVHRGWAMCCTHSDLSLQHGHNLPHHADEVFVFVCVVGEPDSFTDGQDFFADIAKRDEKQTLNQIF